MRQRVATSLVPLILFLLPWQTRWIFGQQLIEGQPFEYGVMSVYAVQVLIVVAALFLADGFKKTLGRSWKVMTVLWALLGGFSVLALNTELAWMQFGHMTIAGLLFLILLDERVSWRRCVVAFFAGLTIPVGLGVWQIVTGGSPAITLLGLAARDAQQLGDAVFMSGGERVLRAYGSFSHPNVFGGYLAVAVVVGMMALSKKQRWLVPLLGIGLLLTFSRSAWIGLLLACVWWLVVDVSMKERVVPCLKRYAVVVVVAMLALLPVLAQRFQFSELTEQRSVTERVQQYGQWWDVFQASPLIGHGMGNYTLALAQQQPGMQWWEYQPVHSSTLVALAEIGIGGVCLLAVLLLVFLNRRANITWRSLTPLIILIPIDLLDHYLWTSWSGIALVAVVFAALLKPST